VLGLWMAVSFLVKAKQLSEARRRDAASKAADGQDLQDEQD
jgi:hypothetical protein